MSRKRRPNKRGRSEMAHVRLWPEEKAGLAQLAAILGETPSRVMRRLLRESHQRRSGLLRGTGGMISG